MIGSLAGRSAPHEAPAAALPEILKFNPGSARPVHAVEGTLKLVRFRR
jgi:hypothetical protein